MNRDQIRDPHWIYPGDVIRLDRTGEYPSLSLAGGPGGAAGAGPDAAASNVVRLDPRVRVEPLQSAIPTIPAAAIGPFLTQPLVIETAVLEGAPTILSLDDKRVIVSEGNTIYADRIGTADGVNWQVFRPGETYRDPETGEILGFEARYLGDARVRRYGDPYTATALDVTKSREEMNRGDRLAPARETTFSSYVPRAPSKPIRGFIMSVDGGVSEVGQYQVVTLNRGSRDGIEAGHVLASYRRGTVIGAHDISGGIFESGVFKDLDTRPVPVVPTRPSPRPWMRRPRRMPVRARCASPTNAMVSSSSSASSRRCRMRSCCVPAGRSTWATSSRHPEPARRFETQRGRKPPLSFSTAGQRRVTSRRLSGILPIPRRGTRLESGQLLHP
jgi:hypothetical protein